MKWKLLFAFVASVSLFACSSRPDEVLSSRKMQQVLVDLHTAEGTLQEAGLAYGHNEECNDYYQQVLAKNGITQAQFDSSLVWYTANPVLFEKIYLKVVDQLQAQLTAADATAKNFVARPPLKLPFLDNLQASYPKNAPTASRPFIDWLLSKPAPSAPMPPYFVLSIDSDSVHALPAQPANPIEEP